MKITIEGIKVDNFRLLRNVEATFEPFTVVVGENGSGKSSFLKSLLFLPWAVRGGLSHAVVSLGGGSGIFHKKSKKLSVHIGYKVEKSELSFESVEHSLQISKAVNSYGYNVSQESINVYDDDGGEIIGASLYSKLKYLGVKSSVKRENSFSDMDSSVIKIPKSEMPCLSWLGIRFEESVEAVYPEVSSSFRLDPSFPSFFREDGKLSSWQESEAKILWSFIFSLCNTKKLLSLKINWLKNIREFLPWINDIKAQRDLTGTVRLYIQEKDGGQFHPKDLSDGTLMLIGRLAMLETGGQILIVDEPEAHLHPSAVEKLMAIYRRTIDDNNHPLSQIIIATQSPFVVRAVHPKEVRLIERIEGGSAVYPLSEDPEKYYSAMCKAGISLDEAWLSGV